MRRSTRLGIPLGLGFALLTLAAGALAERPSETSARLMAQAHAAVDEGRLADARDLWMAVWKVERSQVAACNIGALSFRLGRAEQAYSRACAAGPSEALEQLGTELIRLRAAVDALRPGTPADR